MAEFETATAQLSSSVAAWTTTTPILWNSVQMAWRVCCRSKPYARAQKWCDKRRVNAADTYTCFLRMHDLKWEPPRYKVARKLPFIPTEKEIDQLIAGCSRKFTPLLQLLKETGVRIGETSLLEWTDVNLENGTIRVIPEKGSNPRMLKISNKLRAMLTELQRTSTTEKVFPRSVRN